MLSTQYKTTIEATGSKDASDIENNLAIRIRVAWEWYVTFVLAAMESSFVHCGSGRAWVSLNLDFYVDTTL
jgi:hypothetical protein